MKVLALVVALVLASCGPITPPPKQHFVVVVENVSSSADDVTVRWGIGGIYVGATRRTVPAGAAAVIVMGEAAPDLVELESVAFTTAWGPPDWSGGTVFHVVYPTGFVWSGPF